MILVKTRKAESSIHGSGVFAAEFIRKGTVIWRFEKGFDRAISWHDWQQLAPVDKNDWEKYGYVSRITGHVVRAGDDYVYVNHSHHPNVGVSPLIEAPEGFDIALCDIQPGEELTFDYLWFGEDPCCRPGEGRLPPLESFLPPPKRRASR